MRPGRPDILRLAGPFVCPRRSRSCFAADYQYFHVLAVADMRLTLHMFGTGNYGYGPYH
jgi:hypothetical protein